MYNSPNSELSHSLAHQTNKEYQIYFLFVSVIISLQLICNTIEPIIVKIGGLRLPASSLFYVLSFAISGIITENFGFKLAIRATIFNVISQFIYCGIAAMAISLPNEFQSVNAEKNFHYIFHFLSLELLGSIVALLVASITNDYLINKLKIIFLGKGFWWRTIVSTVIGEVVMLNIDYNIAFYGEKIYTIENLILGAMLYKIVAAIVLALPTTVLSRRVGQHVYLLKPHMNQKPAILKDLKNAFLFT